MSTHDEDDFEPSHPEGYTVPAEKPLPSTEGDESLARYQASLGIVPGTVIDTTGPKVTVLTLELVSPTLPPKKKLVFQLGDPTQLEALKNSPFVIKRGVEYNVRITFKVNHSIVSGLRYTQVAKPAKFGAVGKAIFSKIGNDTLEEMIGSYPPSKTPYTKNFRTEESPSFSGQFNVRSKVVDDDKNVYADWRWTFRLEKEW